MLKGDFVEGDVLEVKQEGGEIDRKRVVNGSWIPISPGEELVMFIESTKLVGFPHLFVQPYQSVYRLDSSNRSVAGNKNVLEELKPVRNNDRVYEGDLTLTIGDLQEMAEENERAIKENKKSDKP